MITSRPANKPFGGFYEFPGGKVKKNDLLEGFIENEKILEVKVV